MFRGKNNYTELHHIAPGTKNLFEQWIKNHYMWG
jgi:hypothetical protein